MAAPDAEEAAHFYVVHCLLVFCLLLFAGVHQERAREAGAVQIVPRAQRRNDDIVLQLLVAAAGVDLCATPRSMKLSPCMFGICIATLQDIGLPTAEWCPTFRSYFPPLWTIGGYAMSTISCFSLTCSFGV